MTRIGVLGTGIVGRTLGSRLVEVGHDVMIGARSATNEVAHCWAAGHGAGAGTFADAAAHGELVVNATAGTSSLAALTAAGEENLAGKVLMDVANPIAGVDPVRLEPVGDDSLAEQLQRAFPAARVVKTLNTVNAAVMVRPETVPGAHDVFLAGDDPEAKAQVAAVLTSFGWADGSIRDLGGIVSARAMETYLLLWLAVAGHLGRYDFNIRVVSP